MFQTNSLIIKEKIIPTNAKYYLLDNQITSEKHYYEFSS